MPRVLTATRMTTRRLTLMSALMPALLLPVSVSHAQPSAMSPAPHTRLPMILLGSGVATATSAGATLATNTGGLLMIALELPIHPTARPARFAVRAESRWSHQSLATAAGSGLSGDVQTLHAGLALRVAPFVTRADASPRLTPYLLAGVGITRPSTRVSVLIDNPDLPSARFGQTASEVAASLLGGLGAQFRVGRAQLFAEARTESARLDAGTRRRSFGTLGVVFQPHR
jgi:hypothetical protein